MKSSVKLFLAAGLFAASAFLSRSNAQVATPSAPVRFEVASIRPAPDRDVAFAAMAAGKVPHLGMKITADTLDIGSGTLFGMVAYAYSVRPDQVSGPSWLTGDLQFFDVLAKFPAGTTEKQVREMLRALLEERFKLTAHRENRLDPVYALLVAQKGPKLEPPIPEDEFIKAAANRPQPGRGSGMMGGQPSRGGPYGPMVGLVGNGVIHVEFAGITMPQLTTYLLGTAGRPVTDQTGLPGAYHVVLDRDLGGVPPASADGDNRIAPAVAADPVASIISAVEKLGLKLESRKDYVEHIVVDHIEKQPTDN